MIVPFSWTFLPFFRYTTCMPLFSRISSASMSIGPRQILTINQNPLFPISLKNHIRHVVVHHDICFNLKISPLCQIPSKVLDISKKTLLTSNPLSKDVKVLCVLDNGWLIQEWPGFKPNWFLRDKFIREETVKHFVKNKYFENILAYWN